MDRRLIDMALITPVTLSANTLYWIAVAMESTGSGGGGYILDIILIIMLIIN